MRDFLNIGLIQPVINPDLSWGEHEPYSLNTDPITADRVWQEIQKGITLMLSESVKPEIILIPELHLPVDKINSIKRMSRKTGIMIISGVDFQRNPANRLLIRNRGIITIP